METESAAYLPLNRLPRLSRLMSIFEVLYMCGLKSSSFSNFKRGLNEMPTCSVQEIHLDIAALSGFRCSDSREKLVADP